MTPQPQPRQPERRPLVRRGLRALAATVAAFLTSSVLTASTTVVPSAVHLGAPVYLDASRVEVGAASGAGTGAQLMDSPRAFRTAAHGVSRRHVMLKSMRAERQQAVTRTSRGTARNGAGSTGRTARSSTSRKALPPRPPAWLRQCGARGADNAKSHSNGAVPAGELCRLPVSGHLLHPDAARGWWKLNQNFTRRFDRAICVTDSYRSYEAQSAVYGAKPGLAAVPGTSNHGWGVALDLCGGVESYSSSQHRWIAEHGPKSGWVNPSWAQADGSRPEPWHWEYVGR